MSSVAQAPVSSERLDTLIAELYGTQPAPASPSRYEKMRSMPTRTQPTQAQVDALQAYAVAHGRSWKSKLINDWMQGRCQGALQHVRNVFGPSWLLRFRLPREGCSREPRL